MKALKNFVKTIADNTVVRPVRYVLNGVSPPLLRHTYFDELNKRIARECADYIQEKMSRSVHFVIINQLWDHAILNKPDTGLNLEFGVLDGNSINYIAQKIPPAMIYGFDSFKGLHVDWAGAGHVKGAMDRGGKPPKVIRNVQLIPGWFDQTVPTFFAEHPGAVSLAHFDCDTYEAHKIVLECLQSAIVPGSVLIFDDYFGYRGWKIGGYLAWKEFVAKQNISYDYLGFCMHAVSIKVIERLD